MKMSIGDVLDRYTICTLKSERLELDNSAEIAELKEYIDSYNNDKIEYYTQELYTINGRIWDLEADIRAGRVDVLGLEEVGRRALTIRELNLVRIRFKNEVNTMLAEGYTEVKMNHGSQPNVSLVITLSTVPERLGQEKYDGMLAVVRSLCEQDDDDYQVHINIPYTYNITGESYVIPDWLEIFKLQYPHLRVFRTEDHGPPTKIIPTINRVDPETILLVVDDDLIYYPDMVTEHRKYQAKFPDCVIVYAGDAVTERLYGDMRDTWVIGVVTVREVTAFQHYKSASYKRKLFDNDFFELYVGRTLSDDVLVSRYFEDKKVPMYVVPYEPHIHLFETYDLWSANQRVQTFPVIAHASMPKDTGCNHPDIMAIQPKFYCPPTLGVVLEPEPVLTDEI